MRAPTTGSSGPQLRRRDSPITLLVASLYDPAANNRGFDNRYWYLNPEVTFVRFVWERDFKRLRVFNRTPGEENGRYLTDAEKDQVVAANNIPAQPE